MTSKSFRILATLLVLAPAPALADEPRRLSLGAGAFDVLNDRQDWLLSLQVNWSDYTRFELKPLVGAWGNGKEDFFVFGGARKDFRLSTRWWLSPSFAIGAHHDIEGKDLGKELEFYSRISLVYDLDERRALSLELGHISNGGLGDINPGAETLTLNYEFGF